MGEAAAALGTPVPFPFRDKVYQLAPLNYEMIGRFEVWLEDRAREKVLANKRLLRRKVITEEEYQGRVDRCEQDVASGLYSYGSKHFAQAASTLPGQKELLFLQLEKLNPEIDHGLIDQIFEEAMEEAVAAKARANADPNSPDPAAAMPAGATSPLPKPLPSSPESLTGSSLGTSAG
jgi:hypothetical protein